MNRPGDITPRRDTDHELYVVVLSNAIHLAANTGRVITCPFIPGQVPDSMALVVSVNQPGGVVLPELIQWLPRVALDEPIGNVGATVLQEITTLITAFIS